MQRSHIRLQSHGEPSARKLGVTGSVSLCDVNNDRILRSPRFLHAFSITAQQAKWTPDPGAYNIFNGSLEADFPSPCVGITNAWTAYRKSTLRLLALSFKVEKKELQGRSITKVQ